MNQTSPNFLEEFEENEVELARQLLELRRQPSAALRQQIQAIPRQPKRHIRLWPGLALASAALVLVFLLATSPAAKAMLGHMEQVIGQIHLMIMEVRPNRVNPVVVETTPVSLAEAQAAVSFEITPPSYLARGLDPETEVFVTELEAPIVKIRWRDAEGGFVQLSVHQANEGRTRFQNLIGTKSSETILINGQEGVIIYGGWDETSQTWSHQDRITTLIWENDDIQYNLLSFSTIVPLTELIAMAQSIR